MKNIGSGRGAGTITAGQFLARFVNCEKGMKTKWAHFDIAGVAFDGKGGGDVRTVKGGTGHSVNMTYKFAKEESK
jgi:leucyl aminopeptidase